MSEFLKTVLNWRQNFFACLPAMQGGLCGTPQALYPEGWGGLKREAFCSVKLPFFFAGQPWPVVPWTLSGRKPASQTQARWVSRLCVDRLSVVD